MAEITNEEIEQVVSEFCPTLEGHRRALKEIAEHFIGKGGQMERAVWHKKLRRLGVSLQLNPALYKRLIATLLGEAKGGKDAHIIT